MLLHVFLWIYLPPELFTKTFSLLADTFKVIEVLGGDTFQNLSHPAHGQLGKIIVCTIVIQLLLKIAHELTSLRLS